MTLILSLIAGPAGPRLDDELVARVAGRLATEGMTTSNPRWMSAEKAVEIGVQEIDHATVRALVSDALSDQPIDIGVQTDAHRRKRLLVADMDSTIIQQECIDELADAMGLRDTVSAITERAMRGELDFDDALRARAKMLAGLDAGAMETVYQDRIKLMPGAETLVATMRAHGALTALVSGGFTFFTGRIRQRAGFDVDQANTLLIDEDDRLSGQVAEPILGRAAKLQALNDLAAQRGLALADTLAVGDGANDLAMIEAAGLGVAFHAKPAVAAQADVEIRHNNLTALLYLQGYRDDEFVTPA